MMMITTFFLKVYNKTIVGLLKTLMGLLEILVLCRKKKQNEIYLILSNFLGDCVYGLAYAEALKDARQKNMIIISEKKRKRLIESYKIDAQVIYLDGVSRDWKWTQCLNGSRLCVLIAKKFEIFNIVPWVLYPMKKYKNSNALDLIRERMFSLPENARIAYPDFSKEPIISIPDFEKTKSRIVIINPYSTSMDHVDFDFFNKVSKELISRGYIIYTNVIRDQKEVWGSLRLDCSIEEFYAICNQVPLVVSVRSGIIDFCISANTNFYIVYFLGQFRGKGEGFAGQYALDAWKTNNVKESVYSDIENDLVFFDKFLNEHNL